jgi:anaerobic ribonucleoside-triphosphate reductase activating protein
MNYSAIKNCDIANGFGVRVSLFVSGCTHHCKNCFNKETWSFTSGEPFTKEVEDKIIKDLAPSYIDGLSLLGGEPMEKVNQKGLLPFLKRVKEAYPDKNIWCYTGYLYEDLLPGGKVHTDDTDELLSLIDILVDGEFVEELYSIMLKFRGSSNQRVIDLNKTRETGEIVLFLQ